MARIESPSSSPPQAAACMPSAMKLRFDSTMPLGEPVVPPEKRMAAGHPKSPSVFRTWNTQMRLLHGFDHQHDARIGRHARDLAALGEAEAEALQRRQVVGNAREQDLLQRALRLRRREGAVERVQRERDARAARVEVVRDLGRRRQRMDQRRHRAELVGGVERDHALGRGRHRDQQALAATQAERGEQRGAAVDVLDQAPVARGRAEKVPGDRLRQAARGGRHRLVERALRIVQRRRNTAVEPQPGISRCIHAGLAQIKHRPARGA